MKTTTFTMRNRKTGAETQSTIQLRNQKREVIQAAEEAAKQGAVLVSLCNGIDYEQQKGLGGVI